MMLSHNDKTQAERMDTPGAQPSQPKLKWRLASLALAIVGISGTALAAHVAGFNLATSAAALFPQGTWLFSALTAVGTLENAGASAAMVAGGLLSVAVIGLSVVLLNVIYNKMVSMVSRNNQHTLASDPSEGEASSIDSQARHSADDQATAHTQQATVRQTAPEPESVVSELEAFWKESAQRSEAFWKETNAQLRKQTAELVNDFLRQLDTPIDSTGTAAQQEKKTPSTDGSLLMIKDRPNDTMSP